MASDPTIASGQVPISQTAPVALSGLTLADAQDQGLIAASGGGTAAPGDGKGTPVAVVAEQTIDKTRKWLAYILLATLLVIIAVVMGLSASLVASCWSATGCIANAGPAMQTMNGTVQPLFTAMVGLVGSVVGFYFGSKTT